MEFKSILKDLREEKGITQKELANSCNLSAQCICALEQGSRNPTGSTIKTLAQYFGVTTDYLLGLENSFEFPTRTTNPIIHPFISKEEQQLLDDYRSLTPALKKMINETIKTWKKSEINKTYKGEIS